MDRLACVEVRALPLQLLTSKHPDWAGFPLAVVDRDTPQGIVSWVNQAAWASGIRPGARYADALSLAPALRATTIGEAEIEAGVGTITKRLQRFSPDVEPSRDMPGIFWLDASGLGLLYGSLAQWGRAVADDLGSIGLRATVACGFTRFGTYAAARSRTQGSAVVVLSSSNEEREAALRTPLERLGLEPKLRDLLTKLGVHTVGTFLRLPAAGLRERFGAQAHALHRLASGKLWAPLVAHPFEESIEDKVLLDEPVSDSLVLLALVRRTLSPLLERLAGKECAARALHLLLALDTKDNLLETVRPAAPTLEMRVLLDLLQLRFHANRLPAGVREIHVRLEHVPAKREQLALFRQLSKRDGEAGARALARLRAELGENAVVRARLGEGHLPEAGFVWEPWSDRIELRPAEPRKVATRVLVRRMHPRPIPLPPQPASERNDHWLVQALEVGPVMRMLGPYVISGAWWHATVHREYHFVETRRGDILWVYYDRKRRRWYLQGRVE
jgi:protein ImuB